MECRSHAFNFIEIGSELDQFFLEFLVDPFVLVVGLVAVIDEFGEFCVNLDVPCSAFWNSFSVSLHRSSFSMQDS